MMVRRRCRWQSLGALKRFHGLMVVKGVLDSSPLICRNLLLSSLHLHVVHESSSTMEYALKIFDQIAEPNLVTWNTIIRATAHSSTPSVAITHFNRMMNFSSSRPDSFTFLFLLKACVKLSLGRTGSQIHGMILKLGLVSDAFVRNALINLHARCGDLCVARALFDDDAAAQTDVVARTSLIAGYAKRGQLDVASCLFDETANVCYRDTVLWNIMITAYANHGRMKNARQIFEQAPHRDVVSWNAMISGYARCGFHAKALEMYQAMRNVGTDADEFTMMSLLASCADCGDLEVGQRIHRSLVSFSGMMSLLHGNAVIDMYAKCGSIERALEVFKDMRERDVWTWNSIIGGLAVHGHGRQCMYLFTEMVNDVRPNEVTFVSLLGMCSHNGMVEEGRRYWRVMTNEYGLEPNLKHCGCMVDMLGRAGFLQEAFRFIIGMRMEPSPVIWRTLLGACKIHGDLALGRIVKEKLERMGCRHSGDYVLLSNIYSCADEWHGAEMIRNSMDHKGVRKEAGCALTSTN